MRGWAFREPLIGVSSGKARQGRKNSLGLARLNTLGGFGLSGCIWLPGTWPGILEAEEYWDDRPGDRMWTLPSHRHSLRWQNIVVHRKLRIIQYSTEGHP